MEYASGAFATADEAFQNAINRESEPGLTIYLGTDGPPVDLTHALDDWHLFERIETWLSEEIEDEGWEDVPLDSWNAVSKEAKSELIQKIHEVIRQWSEKHPLRSGLIEEEERRITPLPNEPEPKDDGQPSLLQEQQDFAKDGDWDNLEGHEVL